MRASAPFMLLFLSACAATHIEEGPGERDSQRLSLILGRRVLEAPAYDDVADQGVIGLEYSREAQEDVVGWELGLAASRQEETVSGTDLESKTAELYGGLRKTFGYGGVRPYVGLGLALIRTELDSAGNSEDGGSLAGYGHAGVEVAVGRHVLLGLDLRTLLASHIEYSSFDTDGDYGQIAFVLAYSF